MILRQWQKKSIYVVASALLLIIVFTLRKPRNIYFETKCVWKESELFFFCFLATRKQICVCNIGVRERKNRNICVCNNLSVTLSSFATSYYGHTLGIDTKTNTKF